MGNMNIYKNMRFKILGWFCTKTKNIWFCHRCLEDHTLRAPEGDMVHVGLETNNF